MKNIYRGHEINIYRAKAMGGWDSLYISIIRLNDGYIVEETPYTGSETIREMMSYMKERVDKELAGAIP